VEAIHAHQRAREQPRGCRGYVTGVHRELELPAASLGTIVEVTVRALVARHWLIEIVWRARITRSVVHLPAIAAVVAEATFLSQRDEMTPLVNVMVVVLFVAEALLGGALLSSRLVPGWIGWGPGRLESGMADSRARVLAG